MTARFTANRKEQTVRDASFLPELKRLMDAATEGPWRNYAGHINSASQKESRGRNTEINAPVADVTNVRDRENQNKANAELITYLVNHAAEIAALVNACEEYRDDENIVTRESMVNALAALNAPDAQKEMG